MIDEERVMDLMDRIRNSTSKAFPVACADFFSYLEGVDSSNMAYSRFESERNLKWSEWGPTRLHGRGGWEFPGSTEDRTSLAWDLFKTAAEKNDEGDQLINLMYMNRRFEDNLEEFINDWFEYFADAVHCVAEDEHGPSGDQTREKQQKFKILDAPNLLKDDVLEPCGILGRAVLFLDLDNFKRLNSELTELGVDEHVLPVVHEEIRLCGSGVARAYAMGGDEFALFLQNTSKAMAFAFAETLRERIRGLRFSGPASGVSITASIGVAHSNRDEAEQDLPKLANLAKNRAKEKGKNCVDVEP